VDETCSTCEKVDAVENRVEWTFNRFTTEMNPGPYEELDFDWYCEDCIANQIEDV